MRPAIAALIALALLLPGCASPDPPRPRAREGDFAILDFTAFDEAGQPLLDQTGVPAVLSTQLPARLPPGWSANATRTLPPGLVRALQGVHEGATVDTPLLPPAEAYGPATPERTIRAPRLDRLSRNVTVGLAESGVHGTLATVRWASQNWTAQILGEDGAQARVRLLRGPENATLELPAYWNEHYQLWRSRFLGFDGEYLRIEHNATVGDAAEVGGVLYVVRSAEEEVVADGNHPLAGRSLKFHAELRQLVFVAGPAAEAPDAILVDLEGRRFNLSDLRGRPVVLDFFATWCVTCLQQAPVLARAEAAYGDRITILSVAVDPTDTPDRVREFQARAHGPGQQTFAFDPTGEASRSFGVVTLPREVVLDAAGRVRSTSQGLHPWEALDRDVAEALRAS